jgi:hypothetical protein
MKGDPAGRAYRKKPFLRAARGRFYVTTRINSAKLEKEAGIRGQKAFTGWFWVFLSGFVGRYPVLGQAGRNCFDKQTPKKGRFFYSIACFGDCFLNLIFPHWEEFQNPAGHIDARQR